MNPYLKSQLVFTFIIGTALITATAQTIEQIYDGGPGSSGGAVLSNPWPALNGPLPAGLFLASHRPDLGENLMYLDLADNSGQTTLLSTFQKRITRFAANSNGERLVTAGNVLVNNNQAWSVHESVDGGTTWAALGANWQWVAGKTTEALGATYDSAGNLVVCGRAQDSRGAYHAIIRRLGAGSVSWETTVLSNGGNFDTAAEISFAGPNPISAGGLFAAGRSGNSWTVWRSQDGGRTWAIVQSWAPTRGIAGASAIATDNLGNIYAGGSGYAKQPPARWYIWTSGDGGRTWSDLKNPLTTSDNSVITDIEVDPEGQALWAVGAIQNGESRWAMQRWSRAGGWESLLVPFASPYSRASRITIDPLSNRFYTIGTAEDESGTSHGLILSHD